MSTPLRASDRDVRALAAIVSEDRPDLPDGEGVPPSLLADLMGQIRCDDLSLDGWEPGRQMCWFSQESPPFSDAPGYEALDQAFWENHPDFPLYRNAARAAPSKSQTSTQPGSGIPPACTPITTGCRAPSTVSRCACPQRCRQPPGPGGMYSYVWAAGPGRTSPSGTGRCSRC